MRNRLLLLTAALVALGSASACVSRRVVVVNDPYYGGRAYRGYYDVGEVRLETRAFDAGVFINGSYAGTARENRLLRLRPGNYTIEIRGAGSARYAESIHVVAGARLHLHPGF